MLVDVSKAEHFGRWYVGWKKARGTIVGMVLSYAEDDGRWIDEGMSCTAAIAVLFPLNSPSFRFEVRAIVALEELQNASH